MTSMRAAQLIAPARCTIPLPEAIDFDVGTVVTDGIATPFHALRSRGGLRAGETVGVFGCGGLGTHAIQLARLMGAATIVAVDIDDLALERASALGADLVLNPNNTDVAKAVRQHVGRAGLDLTIELIGRADTVELAMRCLGKGGRCIAVGIGTGRPTLPPLAAFIGREQSILGSFGMDRADIADLYRLIAAGKLDVSGSISARYPLEQANAALQHLASKRDGVVRVVVEPS